MLTRRETHRVADPSSGGKNMSEKASQELGCGNTEAGSVMMETYWQLNHELILIFVVVVVVVIVCFCFFLFLR